MEFKNKLALTGAVTVAALFLGINVHAARMDMVDVSNNNGLNMTTLASRNGKSIYTTIYPGQRSVVR